MKFLSKLDAHIVKTQQEELTSEKITKSDNCVKQQTTDDSSKKEEENVLDFINEIKNQAMQNTYEQAGFIYEPTSGLYWDSKTGYYWNPESDLYYNGNNGNWYKLNPITNEFTFHSATEAAKAVKKSEKEEEKAIKKILEESRQPLKCQEKLSTYDDTSKRRHYSSSASDSDSSSDYHKNSRRRRRSRDSRSRSRSRSRKSKRDRRSKSRNSKSREDGELDTSNSSDSDYKKESAPKKRKKKNKKGTEYEEIAKKYPPSLRLIVTESKPKEIQVGTLFVVTFKGGTLGRDGHHHNVLLNAENVSKEHLKFLYNNKKGIYQLSDKSRNGTLLNGQQISLLNKTESKPQDLHHGDVLEIANVKLLAHIHEGLSTCDNCEPFNYTQKPQDLPAKTTDDLMPSLSHKEQLKMLQKRYGLQSEKYQESQPGTSNKNYEDRASQRRQKVGSSHDNEKTIQASVDQSISSENKGFKLLSKMGWNTGESLGKNDTGIKEPVQMKTQHGTKGLGNEESTQIFETTNDKKKKEIWSKTQERYNKLNKND
ncbi:hypothetical protein PVAND_007546 [Polypedilum vanderplanki]|uniref:Angiogenic factor with G patch and FHA domains 1 n=1 Tax=Polypedilum vanderplanki TaxID=319348 RepID=A0A9J6C7N3_POLVA|nr:hypothetical protein PVAND_007546 [Polypedilum vanderplanki]